MAFLRGRPGQMGVFKCFRLDMRGRILLCTIVMYMFIASKVCMYVRIQVTPILGIASHPVPTLHSLLFFFASLERNSLGHT